MSPTGVYALRDGWRMAAPGLWIHPTHGVAKRINSRWWTWRRNGQSLGRYDVLLSIIHMARSGYYPAAQSGTSPEEEAR